MKNRLKSKKNARPSTDETRKSIKTLVCIFLILTTLAVYWQMLDHGFVYFDDIEYIALQCGKLIYQCLHLHLHQQSLEYH